MEFLRFLEALRTPVGDTFFSAITHLGEEIIFILVGLLFFWCISKKQGYFILSVGFLGTVINQFLKLTFRIPRPWIRDPEFTIVECARAEATGSAYQQQNPARFLHRRMYPSATVPHVSGRTYPRRRYCFFRDRNCTNPDTISYR